DARLELRDGGLRDGWPAADPAQLGVHRAVRLTGLPGVKPDEAVQELPLLLEGAVESLRRGGLRRGPGCRLTRLARLAVPSLPRLALHEQLVHVLGLEQAGKAEELLLLGGSRHGELAELAAVVEHAVEVRGGAEGLVRELLGEGIGCLVLPLRGGEQILLRIPL